MERIKAKTSDFIAPYVVSCYDETRFCDLVLVCEGNRDVSIVEFSLFLLVLVDL